MQANNNPFDNLEYAATSHGLRFGCTWAILKLFLGLAVLFLTVLLSQCEWVRHWLVHFPAMCISDERYILLMDNTEMDCRRCLEIKQEVYNRTPPELREKIRKKDQMDIENAKAAAASNIEAQKRIQSELRALQEDRWQRNLKNRMEDTEYYYNRRKNRE